MRLIEVAALLLILAAHTLAGAVDGPKSGFQYNGFEEVRIKYEGGEVAVFALASHRYAHQIEVFDPSGKRVAFARRQEASNLRANLAVWIPDKTGIYRIKTSGSEAPWSYITN